MTVAGANLINSQSIERVIMNQAKQFETNLQYLCEKAVFEHQAFGIEMQSGGYAVMRYQQASWQLVEQQQTDTRACEYGQRQAEQEQALG